MAPFIKYFVIFKLSKKYYLASFYRHFTQAHRSPCFRLTMGGSFSSETMVWHNFIVIGRLLLKPTGHPVSG